MLDWNIHHGVGTDGNYNIGRIADGIAKSGANVVSLNEVEKYTGWGNEDQPARFASLLKSKTGKTWYYRFAQRDGNTKGQGNLLLSTFSFESDDEYQLSYSRAVARVAIIVNGIRVNVYSTHLDAESSSRRTAQMRELKSWADNFPEQRIIVGDFNAWPGAGEIKNMTASYKDSWAEAQAKNVDVAYSGNTAGNTRNSRIDYVWYSDGASRLKLKQVKVFDVRDSRGVHAVGSPAADGDVRSEVRDRRAGEPVESRSGASCSRSPVHQLASSPAFPLGPAQVSVTGDTHRKIINDFASFVLAPALHYHAA